MIRARRQTEIHQHDFANGTHAANRPRAGPSRAGPIERDLHTEVAMPENGMVRPCSRPSRNQSWQGAPKTKEHAMSEKLNSAIAVIGIDIGKNSFHLVGQDRRGRIVLRQKWSRGQVEARLANLPPGLVGMG